MFVTAQYTPLIARNKSSFLWLLYCTF